MRCMVLRELKTPLVAEVREPLEPAEGQVVVRLHAAALNRRDYWITQGMYPGIRLPVVLGSDGAGVVVRIGDGVPHHWSQQPVVINPGWNWGDDPRAQSGEFRILGMPADGTYAEEVVVPAEYLHARPDHLTWTEAAALPLGGLTAYRALFTQGQLRPGQSVLITGIGGGVATCAMQLARQVAGRVLVTSSSDEKLQRAGELGADAGYNYRQAGWARQLIADHGRVDLIIDSAGGDGYADLLELAAPGGRIVSYGSTAGKPGNLDLFKLFWKQLHLTGSTMGTPDDFRSMLELVQRQTIRPVVDQVMPLEGANEALEKMRDSRQFGKLVLAIDASPQ